jgi:hypothetical protein
VMNLPAAIVLTNLAGLCWMPAQAQERERQ